MSPTPILDGERSLPLQKGGKGRRWSGRILYFAAVIAVMIFAPNLGLDRIVNWIPAEALLVGFLPALYLGVLLHELGHLAAGSSVGFELRRFVVGSFFLDKQALGWKMRFLPRRILGGGLTMMVPSSMERLTPKFLRLVLGGPAVSCAVLVLTGIAMKMFPETIAIRVLFLVNLLLAAACCIPFTIRSQPSDARLILTLIRKGPEAERLAAILAILALDSQRVDPGDWPPEVVEKLRVSTKDKAYRSGTISIQYALALSTGDAEQIAASIERALEAYPEAGPALQRAFCAAAASFHGIFRRDAARAETWLASARKVKDPTSQKDWDAKALASIAWAKGEQVQAHEYLTRYIALLDRRPATGLLAAERTRTLDFLHRTEGAAA